MCLTNNVTHTANACEKLGCTATAANFRVLPQQPPDRACFVLDHKKFAISTIELFIVSMATVSMQAGKLPTEFVETFQENFDLVDDDKDGMITKEQATLLFRGLGQTPTESEMKEILHSLPESISFRAFCDWFGVNYKDPSSEDAITKAFRVFDLSNSGVLPLSKFRELLTSLGDSMNNDEVCGYRSGIYRF